MGRLRFVVGLSPAKHALDRPLGYPARILDKTKIVETARGKGARSSGYRIPFVLLCIQSFVRSVVAVAFCELRGDGFNQPGWRHLARVVFGTGATKSARPQGTKRRIQDNVHWTWDYRDRLRNRDKHDKQVFWKISRMFSDSVP